MDKQCRRDHPAEYRRPERPPRRRARAGRNHQRQHAENERERRHQNGPQPQLRRFHARLANRLALLAAAPWRTPRSESRSWRKDRSASRFRSACRCRTAYDRSVHADQRSEDTERHRQDAPRTESTSSRTARPGTGRPASAANPKMPAFVALRQLLLIGGARPFIAEAGRQALRRDLLHRRDRLPLLITRRGPPRI